MSANRLPVATEAKPERRGMEMVDAWELLLIRRLEPLQVVSALEEFELLCEQRGWEFPESGRLPAKD